MKPIKNNKKNIVNKFNWKIDSRNKKSLFSSKNFFKSKTQKKRKKKTKTKKQKKKKRRKRKSKKINQKVQKKLNQKL